MINDNKRYDLGDLGKNSGKAGSRLKFLQKLFVTLCLFAVIGGLILVGALIGRSVAGSDSSSEALGVATIIGVIETPTPTVPYTVTEYLTDSENAVNMWGELEEAENPVPCTHMNVHGIYIGAAANLSDNIALAQSSEINSFVIDLKEKNGVLYDTSNEIALASGTAYGAYNLSQVCQTCHDNGIYVIGRIVCFKDPTLASYDPSRAISDSAGQTLLFTSEDYSSFLNPYDSDNWDYLIDLAVEAIGMGVDEIQFDYVRFPTGDTSTGNSPYFGIEGQVPEKYEAINRFIRTARVRIQDTYGIPVSCDVFGITVTSSLDGKNLGQDWSTIGLAGEDSVCPMIYPSHYALGTILQGVTYDKPDMYPYEVMLSALQTGSDAWHQEGYCTVRPYVQSFTATYIGEDNYLDYGYEQINAQIKAIQDAGLDEYILWNASASYPQGNYGGNNG